jgi:26S proteasome regulatory subunit N11
MIPKLYWCFWKRDFRAGKVVIDAFRLISPNIMVLGQEPRQVTSNLGHLSKPSLLVSVSIYLPFSSFIPEGS